MSTALATTSSMRAFDGRGSPPNRTGASTGPWQSELLALPQIFVLTAGALEHAATIAKGMAVDTARMRRNLDLTHGLIMAEAVMMALAPRIGRDAAHDAVERACARAIDRGMGLAEALGREPALKGKIGRQELARLADPRGYIGEAEAVVERVAARAKAAWGVGKKRR